ncbi:MAG: ROK family glucokinase [Oscillospiraceae bacterium]|nr:ROK family glucokinase [Oscillospiraceae bacterium]
MIYYIGIDLGGTNIAIGIVDENYNIVAKKSIPTACPRSAEDIADDISNTVSLLISENKILFSDIKWAGIGTPGSVNSQSGVVERAYNLGFVDTPLKKLIEERLNIECFVENDANAAAYGEFLAGGAKGADSAVCVTIGTGIGGGIILNKRIFSGCNFYGAELGHVVIEIDGKPCNCGRKGCMERYCSATALIEQTKKAMISDSSSLMWQECSGNLENVSGRTAFDALRRGDKAAKSVVERFIEYLACGCTNFVNIFQPDVLLIGGGISKEGDALIGPLSKLISAESFDKNPSKVTKIVAASLGNDAGIIGAAFLGLLHENQ